MKRASWIVIGVAVVLCGGVAAWLTLTPQGRLIGSSYAVPTPVAAEATPASTATDLSFLDVDFASVADGFGGLTELMPDLSHAAEVQDGWLRVRGVPARAGWYSDRSGPMFYRVVSGDFMVETRARAVLASDGTGRPTGAFNSTGLVVRDPSSDRGAMRWLMYNFGQQDGFYGTEAKSTVPDTGGFHVQRLAGFRSRSTLWLTPLPDGVVEASLRICRIGDEFRFFQRVAGADAWTEEAHGAGTVVLGNGTGTPTPGVVENGVIRFVRADMPATVQVGLVSNPGMPPNDGESRFAGIAFTRIDGFEACLE